MNGYKIEVHDVLFLRMEHLYTALLIGSVFRSQKDERIRRVITYMALGILDTFGRIV